jgi:hypothetical protein
MGTRFTDNVTGIGPLDGTAVDGTAVAPKTRRPRALAQRTAPADTGWICPACGYRGNGAPTDQLAHITGEYLKVSAALDKIREVLPESPRHMFALHVTESAIDPDRIGTAEAARILGVSDRYIRIMAKRGDFQSASYPVGGLLLLSRREALSLAAVRREKMHH